MGVNGAPGLSIAEKADGGDVSVANADVAGIPGRASAVDDMAVSDDDVERAFGMSGGCGNKQGQSEEQRRAQIFRHESSAGNSNGTAAPGFALRFQIFNQQRFF